MVFCFFSLFFFLVETFEGLFDLIGLDVGMLVREVVHDGLHIAGQFGGSPLEFGLFSELLAVLNSILSGILLGFADDVEDEGEIKGVVVTLVLELAGVQPRLGEGFFGEDLRFGFEVVDAGFA